MKYMSYSSAPKGTSISLKTAKYIDYVLEAYMITTEHKKKVDALVEEVTKSLATREKHIAYVKNSIEVKKAILADIKEIIILESKPTFFQTLFNKKDKNKESLDSFKNKEASISKEINKLENILLVTGVTGATDLHKHVAHIDVALSNLRDKQKDLGYIKQGKYIQVPINTVRFLVMLSSKATLDLWYEKVADITTETLENIYLNLSGK